MRVVVPPVSIHVPVALNNQSIVLKLLQKA